MAEEKIKEKEEGKEETPKKLKKILSPRFLLIWGGIIIGVLIGAYFAAEKAAPLFSTPSVNSNKEKLVSINPEQSIGTIYPLEPIIVNLSGEEARRYLKITLNLELSGPKLSKEIDTLKPRLLDSLITLLSSKTLEDITKAKGKENLRREILTEFNKELTTGRVTNIYFVEFVIQ